MELVEEINKSVGDSNVKGESEMNKTFLCSLVLKNQELESRLFKKEESLQCNKTKSCICIFEFLVKIIIKKSYPRD